MRSHINDTVIHVSAEEKDAWNNAIVQGYYIGSGANSRTYNLGFHPKAVFVSALEYPPVAIDFTANSYKSYFGVANQSYGSQGIVLTSNGFKPCRVVNKTSKAALRPSTSRRKFIFSLLLSSNTKCNLKVMPNFFSYFSLSVQKNY